MTNCLKTFLSAYERSCLNSAWRSQMLALLQCENRSGNELVDEEALRVQIASELNALSETGTKV